jgi:integrase
MADKKTFRAYSSIDGQRLSSRRFERKADKLKWLNEVEDARRNLRDGKDLTAAQRHVLEQAGFHFPAFAGDIFITTLAAKFLEWRAKNFVAGTANPSFDHLRKYILPVFGDRGAYTVKPSEIRNFLGELTFKRYVGRDEKGEHIYKETGEPLDYKTVQKVKMTFSLLFEYAMEQELVGDDFINPVPRGRRQGSRKAKSSDEIKIFETTAQIDAFLEASRNKALEAFAPLMLAFNTIGINAGPRKSEALALTWEDHKNNRFHISKMLEQSTFKIVPRTKSGEGMSRYVPSNNDIEKALSDWRKISKFDKPSDYIFADPKTAEPVRPRKLNELFSKICEIAEVPDIGPHGLRHTFATHYILNGGTIDDLRILMGHTNTTTTQIYVHLAEKLTLSKKSVVNFGARKGRR